MAEAESRARRPSPARAVSQKEVGRCSDHVRWPAVQRLHALWAEGRRVSESRGAGSQREQRGGEAVKAEGESVRADGRRVSEGKGDAELGSR